MRKKVTSRDVAQLAGVSQSTVSMVLNGASGGSFTEETTRRVFEAAQKLGYKTGTRRSRVPGDGASRVLLIVCPSLTNQYYVNLVHVIAAYSQARGYIPLFFDSFREPVNEQRFLTAMAGSPFSGVIQLGGTCQPDFLLRLGQRVPVVQIDDKIENPAGDLVELNSIKLGNIIAGYLLGLGHRHIAYISTPFSSVSTPRARRLEGMRRRFAQSGLPEENIHIFASQLSAPGYLQKNVEYETGYEMTKLAVREPLVTALVGTNDMVSLGILDALSDLHCQVPRDYSVCGCDNTSISQLRGISLTTVEHFATEKAKEAVDILIRRIEQADTLRQESVPVSIHRVEYEPQLIVRSSSGPVRRRPPKPPAEDGRQEGPGAEKIL